MRNMTGTHVSGDDFCGREHELKRCKKLVLDGNDILMLSPRRVGKTSLSVELGSKLYEEEGWFYIRCDVQSAKKERQFFSLLKQDIQKAKIPLSKSQTKELKKILGKLDKIKVSPSGVEISTSETKEIDLWAVSNELNSILEELANLETRVLLVIDELPIFLKFLSKQENGTERVGNIFDWLNSIRENPSKEGLTWFLCGSIGLDSLAEQLGIPEKIQKFNLQKIGAMPRPEAELLLERLNVNPDSYTHSDKDWINHSLEKIGWLTPNYIQLMFSALQDIPLEDRSDGFPAVDDVDIAYKEMTGKNYSSEFAPWDSRLGDAFIDEDDTKIARDVLDKLCSHSLGKESEALLAEVLIQYPGFTEELTNRRWSSIIKLLEKDGYVYLDGSKIVFLSPLLRDYWKNKSL